MAVGVISKVFRILEAIEASPSGLALKSISEATRLNKSTAHLFLKHLEGELPPKLPEVDGLGLWS